MSAHLCNEVMPPLALLAGGLGTRLGPLTARVPKSLVTVAGEPFIAHQLRLLASQRAHDIVICCGHFGDQIRNFVADGSRFGCRVRYSADVPSPLGTGGAIRNALPLLSEHFWIMYGDSYLPTPFAPVLRAFQTLGQPALMTVLANSNRWDVSNIEFADGRIVRYEKRTHSARMKHIDYGLGIYSAELFGEWPKTFDLSDLQSCLVQHGVMAGYEVSERFYEVGSIAGLEETEEFLAGRAAASSVGGDSRTDGWYEVPA